MTERKDTRLVAPIGVILTIGEDVQACQTRNISKGGIFFKTHQRLGQGQFLDLMIPMRNKGKLLKRRGTVVWSDSDGVGVELQTQGQDPEK